MNGYIQKKEPSQGETRLNGWAYSLPRQGGEAAACTECSECVRLELVLGGKVGSSFYNFLLNNDLAFIVFCFILTSRSIRIRTVIYHLFPFYVISYRVLS